MPVENQKPNGSIVQGIIIVAGRFLQAIGQALTVRVSTGLMTPAQMGGVAQLGGIGTFFYLIAIAPVYHYVTRGFLDWVKNGELGYIFKRFQTYLVLIGVVAAFITLTFETILDLINGFSSLWAAALVGIYILTASVSSFGSTGFNLINKRFKFIFFSNIPIWFGLLFSFIFFNTYKTPEWWCLGQYAGLLLASLAVPLLFKEINANPKNRIGVNANSLSFSPAAVFKFGWPQVLVSILGWVQLHSYKFILDKIQNTACVGLFSTGYGLGSALMMIYDTIFFQYYQPIYFGELSNQRLQGVSRAWNNFARAYIPSLVIFGIFIAANAVPLSNIFLGEQFRVPATVELIIFAAFIEIMGAAGKLLSYLGIGKMDMKILIVPQAAGAVLAPLGVFFFGSISPLRGTAMGLGFAAVILACLSVRSVKKTIHAIWPVRRIAFAVFASLPLFVIPVMMQNILPSSGFLRESAIIFCGGVYMLILQVILLRSLRIPAPV